MHPNHTCFPVLSGPPPHPCALLPKIRRKKRAPSLTCVAHIVMGPQSNSQCLMKTESSSTPCPCQEPSPMKSCISAALSQLLRALSSMAAFQTVSFRWRASQKPSMSAILNYKQSTRVYKQSLLSLQKTSLFFKAYVVCFIVRPIRFIISKVAH